MQNARSQDCITLYICSGTAYERVEMGLGTSLSYNYSIPFNSTVQREICIKIISLFTLLRSDMIIITA